jgi:hypothetical protein
MPREFSLEDAKAAVLAALEQAHREDVVSEADAETYAAFVNSFADTAALDDWVFCQPLFKKRICNFPLCFNPPRASERKGGNQPAYCDDRDETGHPHSDYTWAKRRRKALRNRRDADSTSHQQAPAPDRPATAAHSAKAATLQSIEGLMESLVTEFHTFREAAAQSTDERTVRSEIEAIEHQARENVEREARLRVVAEQNEQKAQEQLKRMAADVQETDAAFEQMEQQAAKDRAERDAAVAAQEHAQRVAEEAIAEARRQAATEIEAAKSAFDEELRARGNDMARQVAEANEAREQALAAAAEREAAATAQVAAANQRATDAISDRDEHKAAAQGLAEANAKLAEANTALRDNALRREREFEDAMVQLRAAHDQDRTALRTSIDDLRARIDQLRADHDAAMERERARHDDILATRLREAADTANKLLTAETARLTAINERLQDRLNAAEQ